MKHVQPLFILNLVNGMKHWFELPLETRNNILIQNGIYDEATPDDIDMNSANDGEEEDIGIFDFGPKFLQKLSPWFGCPDQHFKSPDEMKNFELLLCLYCFYMTCLCDRDSEKHTVMNEIRADQSICLFGPGFKTMPKASSDNLQNYKDFFCHLCLPMKILFVSFGIWPRFYTLNMLEHLRYRPSYLPKKLKGE